MQTISTISLPPDEDLRIADLNIYDIMDTPPEKEFDDLMELAAKICGCPIATITFIDSERQWFKSRKGIEGTETSRDIAFCAYTILQQDVMVISDALNDIRFSNNPEVKGGLGIRFYAGAPIVSMSGQNLGTVCVIDKKVRGMSDDQKATLKLIASQIGKLLELRVKNKILRHHAEKLLNTEKLSLSYTLEEQESERQFIHHEIHENFAQVLSAISLNIEMADIFPEKRTLLLQKTKRDLRILLKDMQSISGSVSPSLEFVEAGSSVPDFIKEVSEKFGLTVQLIRSGDFDSMKKTSVLPLLRIVQLSLQMIKNNSSLKHTRVAISVSTGIKMFVTHPVFSLPELKQHHEILCHGIMRRAEIHLGNLSGVSCAIKADKLSVYLPL